MLNFIEVDYEISEKMDTEEFGFKSTVTLNEGQAHSNLYQM